MITISHAESSIIVGNASANSGTITYIRVYTTSTSSTCYVKAISEIVSTCTIFVFITNHKMFFYNKNYSICGS